MTAKNMYKWHKSAFSLLIAIAMIFSMLPVNAFASDDVQDDIIIIGDLEAATPATTGGEESNDDAVAVAAPASAPLGIAPAAISVGLTFSDASPSGGGDGYYWNATSKTLTLTDFTQTSSGSMAAALMFTCDATIVLNGNNTITNTSTSGNGGGIFSSSGCTLTIRKGTGAATLTVTTSSITATTNAIHSVGDFVMESGTVTTTAAGNFGLMCTTNFTMTGGTIIAQGATSAACVMYGTPPANIAIKGHDGSGYNEDSEFIETTLEDTPYLIMKSSSPTTAVTNAKITVPPPNYTLLLHTDGELYKNSVTQDNKVTNDFNSFGAGTVSIEGIGSTWTLILKEGFDFETSAATALMVPAGTTIKVDGNATVASTKSDNSADAVGIKATGALTVNVAAGKTLTVNTEDGCNTSYGIAGMGVFTKLGDGTLRTTAGSATNQSYGIALMVGDFTMSAGTIIAITNGGGSHLTSNAMMVMGTVSIGDIPIKGINTNGSAYTVDASFQDFSAPTRSVPTIKTIQDSRGSAVYNAKLGKEPEPEPEPTPTPSSGGSSSSKEVKPAPPAPVITPLDDKASGVLSTAINNAANTASSSGKSLDVKLKNVSNFTKANAAAIIAKAKSLGKPATVSSDVMSEDGTFVEVRVTVDPTLIKQNVRLDGYTRASQTFITQTKFTKHFENKTAIISLGQDGKFGQTAKISARLDFKGFDQSNLYLYSYDKKANKYTLITSKDYTIDKKGYLVFNTDFGGDIIVSNGKLMRK